jgi:hypothetical protein
MNAVRTNTIRAVAKQVSRQQIRSKATAAAPKTSLLVSQCISNCIVLGCRTPAKTRTVNSITPFVLQPPHLQKQTFQKNWLSDPSTYPIIVIMGGGLTFMVGMGFNALFGYKDVQINPNKRGAMLQNWGQEERRGVVHRFQEDFKGGSNPEGLGIDHGEWVKHRAEYLSK